MSSALVTTGRMIFGGIPVRTLGYREKISTPGVYAMSIERHHSQCCVGPSVSSSGIREFSSKSAKHFWTYSSLNPDKLDQPDKEAYVLGRAAHHLLLGEPNFKKHFAVRPSFWENYKTAAARKWRDDNIAEGRTPITEDHLEIIRMMRASLVEDPLVQQGILNGEIELSIVYYDEKSGFWVKSRPDVIPNHSGDFADLKTTVSVTEEAMNKTIDNFGYWIQGAVVGLACEAVLKVPMGLFTLIFVEKEAPHCAQSLVVNPNDIELGYEMAAVTLQRMRRCLDTGVWPGPGGLTSTAKMSRLPTYARNRIEARIAAMKQENAF